MTHRQACAAAFINILRAYGPFTPTATEAKMVTRYTTESDNAAYSRLCEVVQEHPAFTLTSER